MTDDKNKSKPTLLHAINNIHFKFMEFFSIINITAITEAFNFEKFLFSVKRKNTDNIIY